MSEAQRTTALIQATGDLHWPLRVGMGAGTTLCLLGAGGWCLLIWQELRRTRSGAGEDHNAPESSSKHQRPRTEAPGLKRRVKLCAGVSEAGIENVLSEIIERGGSFEIYDVHYPSPSDPGAFISYAGYDATTGQWQMTLGNHGWSGGIYSIAHSLVVLQLMHLANSTGEVELGLDAAFFSHYQPESPEENQQMNAKLRAIHGGALSRHRGS